MAKKNNFLKFAKFISGLDMFMFRLHGEDFPCQVNYDEDEKQLHVHMPPDGFYFKKNSIDLVISESDIGGDPLEWPTHQSAINFVIKSVKAYKKSRNGDYKLIDLKEKFGVTRVKKCRPDGGSIRSKA